MKLSKTTACTTSGHYWLLHLDPWGFTGELGSLQATRMRITPLRTIRSICGHNKKHPASKEPPVLHWICSNWGPIYGGLFGGTGRVSIVDLIEPNFCCFHFPFAAHKGFHSCEVLTLLLLRFPFWLKSPRCLMKSTWLQHPQRQRDLT